MTVPSHPMETALCSAAAQVQRGATLAGRFVLHEVLGEGGSGRVFRASDLAVGEEVAVKVLLEEPSPRTLARLAREVRVARRIAHPNIVRVFDLLYLQDERVHLLIMQYVAGSPLSRRVAVQGPLSRAEQQRLFRSLASALAVAHRHGVVHRDVKPENVQLRDDGEPFLLDFGSAAEEGAAALTADGFAPGTPEFMAPEQRDGRRASAASDVYSLGLCVAFAAGASLDAGRVDAIPRGFGSVLARCLHADPARRWRDGSAVASALRARHRRMRIAALLAAAFAVMGGTALAARAWTAERLRSVVLEPFSTEPDPARVTPGAWELLRISLSESPDLRIHQGMRGEPAIRISGTIAVDPPRFKLRLHRKGAPAVELDPGHDSDLFASVDRAAAAVRREIAAEVGPVPGIAALTTARPEAWRYYALAEQELFEHRRTRALAHARAAAAIDPGFVRAQLMVTMITWADGYASRSEGREAIASLRKLGARGMSDQLLFAAAEATVAERGDGARLFRDYLSRHPSDRFAHWLAVRMIRRPAISERLELARMWIEDLPSDPEGYNQLGYLEMSENGDLVTAERYIREGLRLAPFQVNMHDSLADVLHRQARIPEALPVIRRALELDPGSVSALAKAAEYSLLSDDLAEAERYAAAAQSRVDPEMRAFDRVVRVGSALPLLRGDVDGAVAYLARWTHASSTGGRASIPGQLAAYSLALGGRSAESREELARAREVSNRYHAESIPMADAYLDALANWSDPARLEELAAAFARAGAQDEEPYPAGADAVVVARAHLFRGNAALALEALKTARRPTFARQNSGASFMAQWLLGQALWRLGRLGEARAAYREALRRRAAFGVHPESAFFWREFLQQGAQLAAESADEDDAALYRIRLARLDHGRITARRFSRP